MSETGSVRARDRTIKEWFRLIEAGTLKLPRFQRHEAWDTSTVVGLLETVLRGLPAGATLVLNVGQPEPFVSRYLVTAPEPGTRVTEQLLDGQQRLTALWRSLQGTYDDLDLFVRWVEDEDHPGNRTTEIVPQPRWWKAKSGESTKYPVWANSPTAVIERGYVPITLLAPESEDKTLPWLQAALQNDSSATVEWLMKIQKLRERVSNYNVPYLDLPESTPQDVALDVFIKMNTSNFKLTAFDIVVAQVEAAADTSMHDLVSEIGSDVPNVLPYAELGNLLLDTSCLLSGRPASKANYLRLRHVELPELWRGLIRPLKLMVEMLETERIFDERRLPSSPVLPVIVALASQLPEAGDKLGHARTLLRYYLWRSFLTRRYESATSTRAYQDYIALKDAIERDLPLAAVTAPIFNESEYPVAGIEQLLTARWPNTRDILARGALALMLREGGLDIADGATATRDSVAKGNREYHHLYPDSILEDIGGITDSSRRFLALNCALITWHTNRTVSNKDPITYLKDRVNLAAMGEEEVKERLESHLVPWGVIKRAGPYRDVNGVLPGANEKVVADYEAFLEARGTLVAAKAATRAGKGLIGPSSQTSVADPA